MPEVGAREARTVVVRLWFEDSSDGDDCEWRGEVRDVLTGSVGYFRRLEGLVDVLVDLLDDGMPDPRGKGS